MKIVQVCLFLFFVTLLISIDTQSQSLYKDRSYFTLAIDKIENLMCDKKNSFVKSEAWKHDFIVNNRRRIDSLFFVVHLLLFFF
jgi:hypothetical protein